jgi:hypothetical protein
MWVADIDELDSYTTLSKDICLEVVGVVEMEFGEVGNPLIEEDCISFEVYRGYFEDGPSVIKGRGITLRLMDTYDEQFFTLCYKIKRIRKERSKRGFT